MKNQIVLLAAILLISCQKREGKQYQDINSKQLAPNSIVHTSLNEAQLLSIKKIHKTFEEVYPISLDKTIDNFKRDQHPNREIEIWQAMAKSYEVFSAINTGDKFIEKRKDAFQLILMRSMISEKEILKKNEFKKLSKTEVQQILKTYQLGKKPIKIDTH